jgi:hypothetical protein
MGNEVVSLEWAKKVKRGLRLRVNTGLTFWLP